MVLVRSHFVDRPRGGAIAEAAVSVKMNMKVGQAFNNTRTGYMYDGCVANHNTAAIYRVSISDETRALAPVAFDRTAPAPTSHRNRRANSIDGQVDLRKRECILHRIDGVLIRPVRSKKSVQHTRASSQTSLRAFNLRVHFNRIAHTEHRTDRSRPSCRTQHRRLVLKLRGTAFVIFMIIIVLFRVGSSSSSSLLSHHPSSQLGS